MIQRKGGEGVAFGCPDDVGRPTRANRGERKPEARRAKADPAAGRLLLEAAAALLHEARRMDEAREAREASLAPKPVPAKVIH